jgi:hypothetical protein
MHAIRALFVAIAGIQVAMDNPFPRLVAWIALIGQLIVPVLSMMQKYDHHEPNTIVLSTVMASLVVVLTTKSATLQKLSAEELPRIKMRVALILLLSTLVFVGLAKVSPELSIAAYLVFAFSPLKKMLRIEAENGTSKLG